MDRDEGRYATQYRFVVGVPDRAIQRLRVQTGIGTVDADQAGSAGQELEFSLAGVLDGWVDTLGLSGEQLEGRRKTSASVHPLNEALISAL